MKKEGGRCEEKKEGRKRDVKRMKKRKGDMRRVKKRGKRCTEKDECGRERKEAIQSG